MKIEPQSTALVALRAALTEAVRTQFQGDAGRAAWEHAKQTLQRHGPDA